MHLGLEILLLLQGQGVSYLVMHLCKIKIHDLHKNKNLMIIAVPN